jgi:hypothetical protein
MNNTKYNKIVKMSAWYDLIITAPFAFPFLSELVINNLTSFHYFFNFPGTIPVFEPLHFFFINLMGSIIVVWSILRIRHTQPLFGFYDAHARIAFSTWMITYLFIFDATPILIFLLIPEILWGIVQYWGYWNLKK